MRLPHGKFGFVLTDAEYSPENAVNEAYVRIPFAYFAPKQTYGLYDVRKNTFLHDTDFIRLLTAAGALPRVVPPPSRLARRRPRRPLDPSGREQLHRSESESDPETEARSDPESEPEPESGLRVLERRGAAHERPATPPLPASAESESESESESETEESGTGESGSDWTEGEESEEG